MLEGLAVVVLAFTLLAGLSIAAAAAPAQQPPAQRPVAEFDATRLTRPADLDGAWLVHAGDDPAFASPSFDDSAWTPFDPHTSILHLFPGARPEVIWYRMRIRVNPAQTGMGLREQNISRAFEVYVNGERLIASGEVAPYAPYTIGARRLESIPDPLVASGTLLVAIRVHFSASEWTRGQDPGYYANNLTLGDADTLYDQDWLGVLGENLLRWLEMLLLVAVGAVALVLFSGQRHQFEYLWIAGLALLNLFELPYQIAILFHDIPVRWQVLSGLPVVVSPFLWVSIYFGFVGRRIGWRFRIYLAVAGLLNVYSNLDGLLPTLPGSYTLLTNLPYVTALSIIIPVVLILHMRRGNREAGILLIPVILFSLYIYAKFSLAFLFYIPAWRTFALQGLSLIDNYQAGPIQLGLDQISGVLSAVSLAIIMVLRSSSMSRRQAQLEGELAAAQQVQQLLVPDAIESVPGFKVETAYLPAQQVGGDFFQVMPDGAGGLLLVLGDVAGKGLPAAMLVSVLVGAIRSTAEYTKSPAELLANLNERLVGRSSGGFSTALVARFRPDGSVAIANAGHLSPYLDGREAMLPGALPLGIQSGATYETTILHLDAGSRLTFYSDGVIEAQNAKSELLGFERGEEISTQPASAIVEAAKDFGQSDDITVVAITRTPGMSLARAS